MKRLKMDELLVIKNLIFLRKEFKYSEVKLSRLLGVDQAAISRTENGKRRINFKEMCLLSEHYKVSLDAMVYVDISKIGVVRSRLYKRVWK